jgi:surface carbohydrate biosynthesis protein
MSFKLFFKAPRNAKIILFDSGGPILKDRITPLFSRKNYLIVEPSFFYFSFRIFFKFIHFFIFFKKIKPSYFAALIEVINPKVVVTFIDNSGLFNEISSILRGRNSIRFLAIQNGCRFSENSNIKDTFATDFFCFGQREIDLYKSCGSRVENFHKVGSLVDSYYRKKKRKLQIKKYDICIVSQLSPRHQLANPRTYESFESIVSYTKKFCLKHGLSLCVAMRRGNKSNKEAFDWELKWFSERLGSFASIFPNDEHTYYSYSLLDSSSVTIGQHSSLLYEGLGRKNKIFFCNFSGTREYNFKGSNVLNLNFKNYFAFEKRLLYILEMTYKAYSTYMEFNNSYYLNYSVSNPTYIAIKRKINQFLK